MATPIEIIAWILIIASAIKMITLLVNPKAWMNFAKKFYSKPSVVKVGAFIVAGIVLFYLLEELTIVQILASMAFFGALVLIGLASEIPAIMKKYEDIVKKGNMWKDYWFYTLIWVILLAWTAFELVA